MTSNSTGGERTAPFEEWFDGYIVDGEAAAEIGETYGVTAAAV